jgi:hypothetical protein
MYLSEKTKKYVGLVVPLTCCPIGEPVENCPFQRYWGQKNWEERIKPIKDLPEEELDKMQTFHHDCLLEKVNLARKNPDDKNLNRVNLAEHFSY